LSRMIKNLPALFLLTALLLGSCAVMPGQPKAALALEEAPTQPAFHSGVEIAKPTYTASPAPTATPTPLPTATPTAIVTPPPQVFPAGDFVIIENLSPSQGYDNTQPGQVAEIPYLGSKYILVDISEQHLYAYAGEALVYSFVASTGMDNATSAGSFSILNKIPNAYGATWDIWMPNWMGIYWVGNMQNGIHALPIMPSGATLWAGYLGTPISFGCVVLGSYEAKLLYDWADVGTPVDIRW